MLSEVNTGLDEGLNAVYRAGKRWAGYVVFGLDFRFSYWPRHSSLSEGKFWPDYIGKH
jgi:hypothetical protein